MQRNRQSDEKSWESSLDDSRDWMGVHNAVTEKLFSLLRAEPLDCQMFLWNSSLSGNFESLRNCEFARECVPSEGFVPMQERFARLLDTIEDEAWHTCDIYWPLYWCAELADKRKEEWEQLMRKLKDYLVEKDLAFC